MTETKKLGTLYLIPVTLGDDNITNVLPTTVIELTRQLDTFIVENEKTARHFLSAVKTAKPVRELTLLSLNEHTDDKAVSALLAPLLLGIDVGLMSEAGCPGIADPGAKLVALAHLHQIQVIPLVGPSSILLGLMASGFNGQRFTFLGYIPADKSARIARLKELEKQSAKYQETQIFIETPYRNQHLFDDILMHCNATTKLCVASNITLPDALILSQPIAAWRKTTKPDLHKKPTIFLLLA